MEVNLFNYISKTEYEIACKQLRNNEVRIIYNDNKLNIEIKKVGRKVYTIINTFGTKKLNEALNNICSLTQ